MFKSICIFTGRYPTKDNPESAFVRPFACAMADKGIDVSVMCVQSITHALASKVKLRPEKWEDKTENGNSITIYQPRNISLSNSAAAFNRYTSSRVIRKCIKKYNINPDVIYAYFWHLAVQGYVAFPEKPIFVATGESKIWVDEVWDRKTIKDALKHIVGVIGVSRKNIDESRELGLLAENPEVLVAPNAIDPTMFYHYDKSDARRKLGLEETAFIGAFVGEFGERKGSGRVLTAAKALPELKLLMIGKGDLPDSNQVLFRGALPHDHIVDYLNAADFFVLPTLAEGCCNAIVEAMACGLPIVSSDRTFNDDLLDKTNSIRVDPLNTGEISNAIIKLYKSIDLRRQYQNSSLTKVNKLTIEGRTTTIIKFIEANLAGK